MALINQADLEARLGRSLSADEASLFTTIQNGVQKTIENLLGVSVEDASATTRYYDGGTQNVDIDLCTGVTAIKLVDDDYVVQETLDTSDYIVEPINQTLKRYLRYRAGKMPTGFNTIAVTAKFSIYDDTELLSIVKVAALDILVSAMLNRENIRKESIEGYSVELTDYQELRSVKHLLSMLPVRL